MSNIERARGYFERAVELDPTNIDALVGAARADVLVGAIFTTEHRAERLAAAEALLIKGISIAPRNYWAHLWLGFVQIHTNRASRAIGELERALALNRNLGAAHAWMGQAKITMGRAEEAEAHLNDAFRLSPNDAVAFIWDSYPGPGRTRPRRRRGGCGAVSPLSRRQPQLSLEPFLHGRHARASRPPRRGASRGRGWSGSRAQLLDRPLSKHGGKRQPDLSSPTRAHHRRHAEGGRSRGLSARRGGGSNARRSAYRGASSAMRSLEVLAIASPAATSNALIAAQTPIPCAGAKAT